MRELDTSGRTGRVDGRTAPRQRQTNLHDILTATAEDTAARAKNVVGTTLPRRVAGFMNELVSLATRELATKWGVTPQDIPLQRAITVYTGPTKEQAKRQGPYRERIVPLIELTDEDRQKIRRALPVDLSTEAEALLSWPHVGKAIAGILAAKPMSQEVLAGLIGKSKSTIDKGTRGVRGFKVNTVHAICDVFGIPEGDDRREVLIRMTLEEDRKRAAIREKQKSAV